MLAFGRDGILDRSAIMDVISYLQSLQEEPEPGLVVDSEAVARGEEVFAMNCAACHGADAKGDRNMGAPDLTDDAWIYGGDRTSLYWTIYGGRQGHMPHWEGRLSPVERKILTLYILDLPEGTE